MMMTFEHVQLDHAGVGEAQGRATRLQLRLEHTTRIVDHGAHTLRLLDLLKTITVLHLERRRQRSVSSFASGWQKLCIKSCIKSYHCNSSLN